MYSDGPFMTEKASKEGLFIGLLFFIVTFSKIICILHINEKPLKMSMV